MRCFVQSVFILVDFLYYQVGFIAQPGGHKGDVYLDDIKVNHVPASGKCEVGMLKFESDSTIISCQSPWAKHKVIH